MRWIRLRQKTEKAAANSEARGTGYSSGIDWTQDSSCANGDMIVQGEDGYGHMILDEQGRPVERNAPARPPRL